MLGLLAVLPGQVNLNLALLTLSGIDGLDLVLPATSWWLELLLWGRIDIWGAGLGLAGASGAGLLGGGGWGGWSNAGVATTLLVQALGTNACGEHVATTDGLDVVVEDLLGSPDVRLVVEGLV